MLQLPRSDYLSSKRLCPSFRSAHRLAVVASFNRLQSANSRGCCPRAPRSHISSHCPQRCSHIGAADLGVMGQTNDSSLPGLLATCVLMFVGAYGCGMLPSWLPISEQRLASVNALGAGLLLGSALVIILPEGFEAAMEAHEELHLPEWSISLSLLAGFWFMLLLDTASHLLPSPSSSSSSSSSRQPPDFDSTVTEGHNDEHVILLSDMRQPNDSSKSFAENSQPPTPRGSPRRSTPAPGTSHQPWPGVTTSTGVTTGVTSRSAGGASVTGGAASDREARSSSRTGSPLKRPGVSSAGGSFRQLPLTSAREEAAAAAAAEGAGAGSSSNLAARPGSSTASTTARAGAGPAGQKAAAAAAAAAAAGSGGVQASRGVGAATGQLLSSWLREPAQQALLGLMVHAASDGLAVGAASLASEPAVSLSVAAAMVVHKGPVAVGLAAYLRSARWSASRVHQGILLFSLASPVAALLTYLALSALPFLSGGSNIALAVLFSGGTVLYAATMHILPAVLGRHSHHQHQHQYSGSSAAGAAGSQLKGSNSKAGMQPAALQQRGQLLLVSLGMLLPLVLSAVFHHDHHGH